MTELGDARVGEAGRRGGDMVRGRPAEGVPGIIKTKRGDVLLPDMANGRGEEEAMRVDGARFRVVVNPASVRDPEDRGRLRVKPHPPRDQLVLSAPCDLAHSRGGGDKTDEVEGKGIALAAHELVLDKVCGAQNMTNIRRVSLNQATGQ